MENMDRKKIIIGLLIIVAVVVLSFAGCGATAAKDVVARVGSETITKDELYDFLVKHGGTEALEQLIQEKVVSIEAAKQNVTVTDDEVNNKLQDMMASYGGENAFNQALAYSGYTMEDVKTNLIMQLKLIKLMGPTITITDDEMKTYFDENKATFAQEEQVKARHILVESKEKADEVKAKLDAGGDFAELAKTYSTDTGSKDAGGELGYFGKGSMVKEFEDVAFALKVGETSGPVKTDYGYHIIQVEDKKPAKEADFEASKDKIRQLLLEQKVSEQYNTWVQAKKEEMKVENLLK